MASLSRTARGGWVIQFYRADGSRPVIHLGKMADRLAEQTRNRIETLIQSSFAGSPPDAATSAWLAGIDDRMADRLHRVGLTSARQRDTLATFIDRYIAQHQVKPGTRLNLVSTRRLLVDYFGDVPLESVHPESADGFVAMLRGRYAIASWSKHLKRSRQFFTVAIRWQLIASNPFAGIAAPAQSNAGRAAFVPADDVRRLIAATTRPFGLVLALSRWGGLRVPSEIVGLTWADIDWHRGRFTVRSPKTGVRVVPLFPELRDALTLSRRDSGPVVPGILADKNMRPRLERLILRCGLKQWPRLFHNMRASRQTELAAAHPLHVVCAWLGNSPTVANRHYLQVRDDDFERASAPLNAPLQPGINMANDDQPDGDILPFKPNPLKSKPIRALQVTLTGTVPPIHPSNFCRERGGCAAICATGGLDAILRRWDMLSVREKAAMRAMATRRCA